MTQRAQIRINIKALSIFSDALVELSAKEIIGIKRLRSCSARVLETENYYILESYDTKICVIDKRNECVADVLRIVYGYTATSAQHIAKFIHDYAGCPCNYERLTAR